jgi:hypothetical protein
MRRSRPLQEQHLIAVLNAFFFACVIAIQFVFCFERFKSNSSSSGTSTGIDLSNVKITFEFCCDPPLFQNQSFDLANFTNRALKKLAQGSIISCKVCHFLLTEAALNP